MSYQSIRLSLATWERLLKSLNAAIFTAALCVALYGLIANFSALRNAIADLFFKVTQLESIEALNIKAAFKVTQIAQSAQIYQDLPTDMKALLPDDILALKAAWVERLLYVGDQGKLCDFAHPTDKMTGDLNADRHLAADGLITIKDAPQVRGEVLKEMRAAKEWTIGEPQSCYVTELTPRGRNVKTALVQFLSAGFAVAAAPGAEARNRRVPMKLAGVDAR